MHSDDFYHYIQKRAIPPFLPESQEQNLIVIEAFLEAAKRFARVGYDVIIDGILGPWFLKPWLKVLQDNYEVHYIILRATDYSHKNVPSLPCFLPAVATKFTTCCQSIYQ